MTDWQWNPLECVLHIHTCIYVYKYTNTYIEAGRQAGAQGPDPPDAPSENNNSNKQIVFQKLGVKPIIIVASTIKHNVHLSTQQRQKHLPVTFNY